MVSGYTSSQGSEGRYSGKFRVMQHRSSLSLSRLLFLFLPFVHSLILLSCAYSPLTILFFLRPSSPTNRLFCQFLAPFLSLFLSLSSTLERAVYKTHEVYVYVCRIHSSSSSTTPCRPAGISGLLVSSRFVSFRFSSPRISLRYARGDLGAQPPTRELVNYFAQRDTSFMLLDPFLSLSLSSCARFTRSRSVSLSSSLALSLLLARARGRLAYDICGEVQSGGSFQVATKCVSRRPSALLRVKKIRFEFYFPFLSFVFFFLRNGSLFRVDRVKK